MPAPNRPNTRAATEASVAARAATKLDRLAETLRAAGWAVSPPTEQTPDDDVWAATIRRHHRERVELDLRQAEELAALATQLGAGYEGQAAAHQKLAVTIRRRLTHLPEGTA